jgi:intracellular sulfur oxidation DsrE/DsrF family protein
MHSLRISNLFVALAFAAGALALGGTAHAAQAERNPPTAHADTHASGDSHKGKKSCVDSSSAPKAVFQVNDSADTALVLRVAANYLLAEPNAEVTVVGYGTGAEFMLKDARDPNGKLYAEQINRLADRGVVFKACNNWLKSRNLTADALVSPVSVVPSAVIEILRLQTQEGYAYFKP